MGYLSENKVLLNPKLDTWWLYSQWKTSIKTAILEVSPFSDTPNVLPHLLVVHLIGLTVQFLWNTIGICMENGSYEYIWYIYHMGGGPKIS